MRRYYIVFKRSHRAKHSLWVNTGFPTTHSYLLRPFTCPKIREKLRRSTNKTTRFLHLFSTWSLQNAHLMTLTIWPNSRSIWSISPGAKDKAWMRWLIDALSTLNSRGLLSCPPSCRARPPRIKPGMMTISEIAWTSLHSCLKWIKRTKNLLIQSIYQNLFKTSRNSKPLETTTSPIKTQKPPWTSNPQTPPIFQMEALTIWRDSISK